MQVKEFDKIEEDAGNAFEETKEALTQKDKDLLNHLPS